MAQALLLGRTQELEQLVLAADEARAGRGAAFFVSGEPGIGKTRLVEELARIAQERGMEARFGRAWEAGGAPAYWAFIQALRELLTGAALEERIARLPRARIAPIVALLPELAPRLGAEPVPVLEPAQARFALLDAVSALWLEAARQRPLLLVLEDLHAADPATLELLEFLAGQLRSAPLLLVVTHRPSETARSSVAALLARVARRGRTIVLRRLTRPEVAEYLTGVLGRTPQPEAVNAVFERTEGNPLFLTESARLLERRGGELPKAIPHSVRAAIEERLGELEAAARGVLELASVAGREFRRSTLARVLARDSGELAVPLASALDAGVLEEHAPGHYRFAHVLFRDVAYEGLGEPERQGLHLRMAEALEAERGEQALSELAHHYASAGPRAAERAVQVATRAARQALEQFAFGEAARLFRVALGAREHAAASAAETDVALRIELGLAQILAGERAQGQASCLLAADHARREGEAELLARAALAYGSVLVVGHVDDTLVGLLREALARMPERELAWRARLLARLAAALQPARDPSEPIAIARQAIELARRHGEPRLLLEVLRAGCSAMIDVGDPFERLELNHEYVALAERLGQRAEVLRGIVRRSFDEFELGQVASARGSLAQAERIAAELAHPHFGWRVAALSAMRAAFEGDFERAFAEHERARALGARAGDPNAERTLLLQHLGLLRQQGRAAELRDALPAARASFVGEQTTLLYLPLLAASAAARTGAEVPRLSEADFALEIGDHTLLEPQAEVAAALSDPRLVELVSARVSAVADRYAHGGMLTMTWDGPLRRSLALLHASAGRFEQARASFEGALQQARAAGSRTEEAWTLHLYARFLRARGEHERAERLHAAIAPLGVGLALGEPRAAIGDAASVPAPAASGLPRVEAFQLTRDGELWKLARGDRTFHLKDSKGLRALAQLLAEPGREFHVLELVEPGGGIDTGDRGEVLDEQARRQYRARIEELREELEDAQARNDLARSERASEELELLSRELAGAVGLGGRVRKSGAATERARVNVQRRLRDALERIAALDPELARHLDWAVRTGIFCSYDPK